MINDETADLDKGDSGRDPDRLRDTPRRDRADNERHDQDSGCPLEGYKVREVTLEPVHERSRRCHSGGHHGKPDHQGERLPSEALADVEGCTGGARKTCGELGKRARGKPSDDRGKEKCGRRAVPGYARYLPDQRVDSGANDGA